MIKTKLRYAKALFFFTSHLPETANVLELNAEQLTYSKIFYEHGYRLTCVELYSGRMIHENPYAVDTYHKPLEEVILPFRSMNGIWAHQSFSAISRKEFEDALNRCSDWLAPGGLIFFCMPEGEGEMFVRSHTPFGEEKKRKVFYQTDQLAEILIRNSFEVVDAWRQDQQDYHFIHLICRNS